jgi:hypothetical protein
MTTTEQELNLGNFREQKGVRFRTTNPQQARIVLTGLSPEQRAALAGLSAGEVAVALNKHNAKGQPFRWMALVGELAANWSSESELTREKAFEEFVASGGVQALDDRKPPVPDSVYLEEGLTLENYQDRVLAATGVRRRFRLSTDLSEKVRNKTMTREQAFQETISRVRAQAQENNNEQSE